MIYPLVTAGIFAADQLFKYQAKKGRLPGMGAHSEYVRFSYTPNKGAMLNLGEKHPALIRWISVVLTLAATVVFLLTLGTAGKGLLKSGLSLLLGGAYSNTYDRLKDQYVTDYLSFRKGPKRLQRIVYNIGDFAIMIGALLTALGA